MKIYQAVKKLLVGDTQTDTQSYRQKGRHTVHLISLIPFFESRGTNIVTVRGAF
jgi:hypothetical protein